MNKPHAYNHPLLLQKALLDWFTQHKRALPWRESYSPYAVWVSEIMLQQTQMERGVVYFSRWMEQFPTIAAVAFASEDRLLKAWEGLGYYTRARNIHAAARIIMEQHGGIFPDTFEAIRALPGIGDYTAGAIASIAYNQPVLAIDANVERLIARLDDIDLPIKSRDAFSLVRKRVQELLPLDDARNFNQALMELGALVCNKTPNCAVCPLQAACQAYYLGIVKERPIRGKKTVYTPISIVTGALFHKGRVLIQQRLLQGVWAGLWEFPGGRIEPGESPETAIVREFFEETELIVRVTEKVALLQHSYTTYRVSLHCFICELCDPLAPALPVAALHAAQQNKWLPLAQLDAYAFPAGHRKFLDMLHAKLG